MGFVAIAVGADGLVHVPGLGIDRGDDPVRGDALGNAPRPVAVAGFDVLAATATASASGTSFRTRRIAETSWVTVSWVATVSSSNVESNARRRCPASTPVSSITARTASKIRSGAPRLA